MRRCASLAVGVAVIGGLGGCARSGIKFTNVSDSWLNVWFYVGPTEAPGPCPNDLYRQRALQVEPGASANYRPPRTLVHIQVVEVSPTWVPTGREYWLELLTCPPIHIVANGRGEKLEFKSFRGQIAIIPEAEWADGRFEHRIDGERQPVDADTEETAAVTGTPE